MGLLRALCHEGIRWVGRASSFFVEGLGDSKSSPRPIGAPSLNQFQLPRLGIRDHPRVTASTLPMPTTTKTPTPSASRIFSRLPTWGRRRIVRVFTEFSFRLGAVCMYKVGRDPSLSQPLSWDFAEYLKGYTNSSDGRPPLKHAVAVFLLVKSPRVPCLPRHNFGLSASRRPQRNYCQ